MIRLMIALFLINCAPLHAQDAPEQNPQEPEQTETEDLPDEKDVAPEAGNLQSRKLGDAFRNFTPSEEISADNAVSFPVDI